MISMKENSRNCCVCGSSTSKDPTLTLHRFPKPGPKNAQRCELWSKYSFPNDAWSSPKFQDELYTKHKMLCSKHFRNTCFLEKKLFRTAVPDVQYHRGPLSLGHHGHSRLTSGFWLYSNTAVLAYPEFSNQKPEDIS